MPLSLHMPFTIGRLPQGCATEGITVKRRMQCRAAMLPVAHCNGPSNAWLPAAAFNP